MNTFILLNIITLCVLIFALYWIFRAIKWLKTAINYLNDTNEAETEVLKLCKEVLSIRKKLDIINEKERGYVKQNILNTIIEKERNIISAINDKHHAEEEVDSKIQYICRRHQYLEQKDALEKNYLYNVVRKKLKY